MPSLEMNIEAIDVAGIDDFLAYLSDHISDNGDEAAGGYFLPLPRGASMPDALAEAFLKGLQVPVATPGWRRGWVARSGNGKIVGHIDLRAYSKPLTEHRCVLGMGVDRNHRMAGIGTHLMEHAERWALGGALEWIDLEVLSTNLRAIRLYQRAGFTQIGEIPDMFRIEGRYLSYTTMTKRLLRPRNVV